MHMLVYIAYALIIVHVATGALQYEEHPIYWVFLCVGFLALFGLHLVSALKSNVSLRTKNQLKENGFYEFCDLVDIQDHCAKSLFVKGENIAVFKYDGCLSAVSNICKHQQGPLSEGKIIDGCITCPWHGYQYLPENGQSPPPFNEKLKTYKLKQHGSKIWVNPEPLTEGSFVEPVKIQ